jgi:hypothetical protein
VQTDDGLAQMHAVEPRGSSLGKARERHGEVRDAGRVAIAEERGADDEQPHLRRHTFERCVERRHEERVPEGTQRASALMVATEPCAHVALWLGIGASRDQRTPHLEAIERGQVGIARETGHEVQRRGQCRGA